MQSSRASRTQRYLKYMYGEGGIYEQLQELKMPAEEVLTKALTFLDPLVPGKQTTVSIKSFDPPSVKESRARARAAAKRSDALEAGIKQELKDYFGWLQRFAKDIDEDVERATRRVPGAYMWVTDETGERKKKCVGVQKIYRSEKDRTLLKQKLAMKTPDFYWRNLDEMKAVQLDKNTGQLYGPYWRKRAEKGTFKMRERERQSDLQTAFQCAVQPLLLRLLPAAQSAAVSSAVQQGFLLAARILRGEMKNRIAA